MRNDLTRNEALFGIFVYITVLLIGGYGWISNIVTIWHTMDNPVTAKFVLRCIGIFVAPIGAILGYI